METCPICTVGVLDNEAERATLACDGCQKRLGLVPMPPARSRGPCRQCGGKRFLRVIPREHAGHGKDHTCAQMFLTHAPRGNRGAMMRTARELTVEEGVGALEVYVCFGCGAAAWYCNDVAAIPVHPHYMTAVVDES